MRPFRLVLIASLLAAGLVWAADVVGAESCKSCHPEAYQAWRQSKHARGNESLTPQQQRDARCTSCHSPAAADQASTGITCETCHGAGQFYASSFVMKDPELSRLVGLLDPSEKGCRTCHDASSPSLKPFEFVEKLKTIDHWSAERTRRAQGMPAPSPHGATKTKAP